MKKRIEGLKGSFMKMNVGELLKENNVIIFFDVIWFDDEGEKEYFVKFHDNKNISYQVFLFEDGSIKYDKYDEDEILELISFHNKRLLEGWMNF